MARVRRGTESDPPFRHESHRRPFTRREFLAQGFITGAAWIASPTILGLLRSREARAQAAACGIGAGAGKIPFIAFDLGGGASVAGSNVVVGGPGGQLDFISDAGYLKLGLPSGLTPRNAGQVNTELGIAFHADSAFLRGIQSRTSATTRANVNGCVICARSENDTGNNPHNPMYGINKAGADGQLVTLIGTDSSVSGGNSAAPMSMIDPSARPVKVDRPGDARGLVDTGKLVSLLNQTDAAAVMAATEQLSDIKLGRISEDAAVEQIVHCGYAESTFVVSTFGSPDVVDAALDPDIAGAGGIFTAAELGQSEFRKTAAVMKLVVNGYAGAGTIELSGYDYHDSTRSTGELKDFRAGEAMGAALEYAARRGQQLVLYVFSDGSLASDGTLDNSTNGRGKGIWKNDNAETASTFMLVYDPAGPPQLTSPAASQIGWFRSSGTLETSATPISNNVEQLVQAVVLNYLALHNELGRFDAVLPGHGLGTGAARDALVAFQPIR